MATRYWTNGSATNNVGTAGNWSASTAPIDGDTAVFSGSYSTANATVGMAGLTGVDLAALIVEESYTGDIGTTSALFEISANYVEWRGKGNFYYNHELGDSDTADNILLDGDGTCYLVVDCATSTAKRLIQLVRGTITVKSTSDFGAASGTVLMTSYRTNPSSDARVTIEAYTNGPALYMIGGGTITSSPTMASTIMRAGTLTKITNTMTTVNQTGGNINFNLAGTVVDLNLMGGTFDLTQTGDLKTITNSREFPGAKLAKGNSTLNVITNRTLIAPFSPQQTALP